MRWLNKGIILSVHHGNSILKLFLLSFTFLLKWNMECLYETQKIEHAQNRLKLPLLFQNQMNVSKLFLLILLIHFLHSYPILLHQLLWFYSNNRMLLTHVLRHLLRNQNGLSFRDKYKTYQCIPSWFSIKTLCLLIP